MGVVDPDRSAGTSDTCPRLPVRGPRRPPEPPHVPVPVRPDFPYTVSVGFFPAGSMRGLGVAMWSGKVLLGGGVSMDRWRGGAWHVTGPLGTGTLDETPDGRVAWVATPHSGGIATGSSDTLDDAVGVVGRLVSGSGRIPL